MIHGCMLFQKKKRKKIKLKFYNFFPVFNTHFLWFSPYLMNKNIFFLIKYPILL